MTQTPSPETIVYADDLASSGIVIQALFEFEHPNGMKLVDMMTSSEGWICRAAEQYIEERENV